MAGAYLAFAVGPEVHHHADDVVEASVCALVDQKSDERAERVDDEAGFDGAVEAGAGEEAEGPLPGEADEAHDDVDDLEGGHGLDGDIEVLGQKVPEDLGPKKGLDAGGDLVGGGRQDDEARPVVLDQFPHGSGGGMVY